MRGSPCGSRRLSVAIALCLTLLLGPSTGVASADTAGQFSALQSSLEQSVSGQAANYGIYVLDLKSGKSVVVDPDGNFPTASMYKLLVMYRVFQAFDRGTLSPDQPITITEDDLDPDNPDDVLSVGDTPTVAYALNQMITVSDNAAAWALTREVGGWSSVITAAAELGMDNSGFTDDFYGTPRDFAHFFHLLAERQLVSPAASDQMLALLAQQTVNDRLPALLPADASVAHKTGELPGVRNDGGIVHCGGESYVVVMMSKNGDPDKEVVSEAQMSRAIYDQLCG